jgi:hypothetical protein
MSEDKQSEAPEMSEAQEEYQKTMADLLEGKDLEGKSVEELKELVKGERQDSAQLLGKYSMGVLLNASLCGAAKRLLNARVDHPKHDEKAKTFLVYQDEFIDLGVAMESAETDFHELVMGETTVPMTDIIAGYEYIMEQRKLTAKQIADTLDQERDMIFHQMHFFVNQLAASRGKEGFEALMDQMVDFVHKLNDYQKGKSGTDLAREKLEAEQGGEHSHTDESKTEEGTEAS